MFDKTAFSITFILKIIPEACLVVPLVLLVVVVLLGFAAWGRKASALMPLDDGCFRDFKLRTPAFKAAPARPSRRLPSRPKAKRGEVSPFGL